MSATARASFRLAKRFDEVGFSDIVQIRNRVIELRARGETVYQFEGGEPYRQTPDYIKQAISSALAENKTRYAPSSGISELRHAIAYKLQERNHIDASSENVIVVNGGMQGLFGAFQSIIDPEDDVLATCAEPLTASAVAAACPRTRTCAGPLSISAKLSR